MLVSGVAAIERHAASIGDELSDLRTISDLIHHSFSGPPGATGLDFTTDELRRLCATLLAGMIVADLEVASEEVS